jgi:hypothetical protein
MAELSNALGVDGMLMGDVAKIGRTYTLTVKVLSASDGERLAGYSGRASSEEELLERIGTAGREMAATLRDRFAARMGKAQAPKPSEAWSTPLRGRSWIPAAGAGALGVASGLLYLGALNNFNRLNPPPASTTTYLGWDEAQRVANEGKLFAGSSIVTGALGIGALGVAAWMFVAPGPKAPLVVPTAGPKGAGVSLVWGAP